MNSKKISLIVGLLIPVLMVIVVAASIYLPRLFAQPPTINFLYLGGANYYDFYGDQEYRVENNVLVRHVTDASSSPFYQPSRGEPMFYLYDVHKDQARTVSFDEASRLKLDSSPTSADGFTIVRGGQGGGGFFPFFFFEGSGGDYYARYLSGHGTTRKLNLGTGGTFGDNFRFLGWISQ